MHLLSSDPAHNDGGEPESPAPPHPERALKLAIGAFAAVLLATIIVSVHLSTLTLSYGTLLYGPRVLWRGHDATFRIAPLDPLTADAVGPVRATVSLRDSRGSRATASATGGTFAEVHLRVPPDLERDAIVDVHLHTAAGDDHLSADLRAVSTPPPPRGRIVPYTAALLRSPEAPAAKGGYAIALYPPTGVAVRGLVNHIDGILTENGKPTPAAIAVLQQQVQSDAAGLFSFTIPAGPPPADLGFDVGKAPSIHVSVPLKLEPTQLALAVHPGPFVQPGTTLDIKVTTLPFHGPVHVDVWAGGALLLGTSDIAEHGERALQVGLPKHMHGFLRIDAYHNFVAPEGSTSTRLLWVSRATGADAATEALTALKSLPGSDPVLTQAAAATGDMRIALCRLALSRFVPTQPGMPMLGSSLERRQNELESRRDGLRAHVHTLFLATLLFGLGLAIAFVLRHHIRMRRAVRRVVEDGIAAGEDIDPDAARKLARATHTYQLLLALGAVLLAGYSLWLLLVRIRWVY